MTLNNISDKEIYLFGVFLTWIRLLLLHYLILLFFSEDRHGATKQWDLVKRNGDYISINRLQTEVHGGIKWEKNILEQKLLQVKENDKY